MANRFSRTKAEEIVDGFNMGLGPPRRYDTKRLVTAISNASEFNDNTVAMIVGQVFGENGAQFLEHYKEVWDSWGPELPTEESLFNVELAEHPGDCNAILFIFETSYTQKVMLKVSPMRYNDASSMEVNISVKDITSLLKRKKMVVPKQGNIQSIGRIGKYMIFIYKFSNCTRCSKASERDFTGVVKKDDIVTPRFQITRNVAWAFYSLDDDINLDLKKHFVTKETLHLRPDYIFPTPTSEEDRMKCLETTIANFYQLHGSHAPAKVTRVNDFGSREGYCEFTGGGDVFVHATIQKETLVITKGLDEVDPSLSPIEDGTCLSGVTIEGKKCDVDLNHLKYQLFANITLASITTFVKRIQQNDYNEATIQDIEQISGYGVAYTGAGHFGFYKMHIRFGEPVKFVTKIELKERSKVSAASCVDFSLDYFFGKLKKQNIN